ncbi:MAG: AzlD domain-containing protein [Salinigranum sp.]
MTATPSPVRVWLAVALIAVITFALRFSFIFALGRFETVPPWIDRTLRFVPAAVMTALAVPAFLVADPTAVGGFSHAELAAGLVGALVARRTEDVAATVLVGMATLWFVRFVLPHVVALIP